MTSLNSPAKTNLPVEPNAFVGRERDTADIRRLLESMRAVTLCGAGGIGKTRLARHVAHSLLGVYPEGVWFVELADTPRDGPPEPVARRVAAVLGVAEEAVPGGLAAALAEALRSRAALLVLDNCEHLVADCAELTGALLARCPRLRVLATSREPLRTAGENVWRVPPLEPHEAERLFVERAAAVRPGFAAAGAGTAVAEVSRALDGVPLALELAAARIRVMSVEQIARRLTDRFRLLNAGDRNAPLRQRTLRAAIDWSHDLLDDDERTLLRRLSVFAGWTLEQAEHVCSDSGPDGEPLDALDRPRGPGGPGDAPGGGTRAVLGGLAADAVLDLLTALVDKSLVVVGGEVAGEVRFRQLDSIRQYAAERLGAAGEAEEFRRGHRDAVLEAAERHGEIAVVESPASWAERVELFHRYDAELGNVRAALAWSLDRGEIEEGLRICTALRTFWIVRGRVAEWEEWTDRFLTLGMGLPAYVLGPALAGRAQLAVGGRDFARAGEFAERALDPCRKAGDDFMAATALITVAESHTRAGRFAEAAVRLDEADAIAADPGQEWNRAYALTARGYLLIRLNRLREARERLESGLLIMREIGQLWGASHALIGLGRLAELRGDPAAARGHYAEALPILAEIEARPEMARALAGVGRVALEQGDPGAAREALSRSLGLSRSTGVRLDVARALEVFAELVAREGDPHGAVLLAGAASALREAGGRQPGTGARLERTLEPIRRRLGRPLVAQLWGEGRALPPDDAAAYALRVPGPGSVPAPREAGGTGTSGRPGRERPGRAFGRTAGERAEHDPAAPGPGPVPEPRRDGEPGRAHGADAAPGRAERRGAARAVTPVTPPTTLTAREREIARLIARGLSNRGIAGELVISPATVARHVTNILTKLGFGSRAQVAVWAVDNLSAESPDAG